MTATFLAALDLETWVIIPILILLARVVDVSLDTVRVILISRGNRLLAPLLGFVQVSVWLLAMRQVFTNLDNPVCFVAYALGFALGTLLGVRIEGRLAMGHEVMRIITSQDASDLVHELRGAGHGLTVVPGQGAKGPVSILFMLVRRRDLAGIIETVRNHNPRAFYSVEDVRTVSEGILPVGRRSRLPLRVTARP